MNEPSKRLFFDALTGITINYFYRFSVGWVSDEIPVFVYVGEEILDNAKKAELAEIIESFFVGATISWDTPKKLE